MKKGWETKTLGDVCERVTVGHVGITSPHYRDSGIPFLRTQNVGKTGLVLDDMKYVTPEFHASLKKSEVKAGDILMSRVITHTVHCALIPPELGPANCANVVIVRPSAKLFPEFLVHYVRSSEAQRHLLDRKVGSAQLVVNTKVVQTWPIPVPPLPEQYRIVRILDEAFEGIATAKAIAEKNLRNARELFESHLEAVFSQRGEGWVEATLESLGEIRTGRRDANHQVENGPYPFYTCAIGQFKSPTFSFDGPSIILPGNGANVGKVFFYDGKFEAYQRTYVVNELSQSIDPRFLYYCFTANWPGWIATKQFGSATNYIVVGDLKAFPVRTPSLRVQMKTVEQLESFTTETQRLAIIYERKLAALDELKKSLLHQAFSGEL